METRIIVGLFVISNFLFVLGADFNRENVTNSILASNEVEDYLVKVYKNHKPKPGLAGTQLASKMSQILLQSDDESARDLETPEKTDPIEEGNRKILRFGKRVFESIKRHGVMAKEIRLLKSGKYQIDWWRQNRRLEEMRERLSGELERNPELKLRLYSLGWRNNSGQIFYHKKINADNSAIKNAAMPPNEDVDNTILNTILLMDSKTENPETDTPTKFSLSTFDQTGENLGGTASDFGVIGAVSGKIPSSSDESSTSDYPSGQLIDSDRFLELIPLVVEELRQRLIPEEERRAFRWIFGNRLWQLLEREASKRLVQTMDHDLAKFLFKGELHERGPVNVKRGRHRRRKTLGQKKRKVVRLENPQDQREEHHRDYNDLKKNYDYYKGMKSSINSDEEKIKETNIDPATQSRKLHEQTKRRKKNEEQKKKKKKRR